MSRPLEEVFEDLSKRMKMWETWKLKTTFYRDGEPTTYDRMSPDDKEFNKLWNELRGICMETSLDKLKGILSWAREITQQ